MLTQNEIDEWWDAVDSGDATKIADNMSAENINLSTDKYFTARQQTALMFCLSIGLVDSVAVLLGNPYVDVNHKDSLEDTALFYSLRNINRKVSYETTEMLLIAGSDPNTANGNGTTPLVFAVKRNYVGSLPLLLEHGARDVDMAIETARELRSHDCLDVLLKWKSRQILENTLPLSANETPPTL